MKKEYFLEKAREVHGDKYDYSLLPEDIKYNGKIEIRCPIHGKFSQLVNNHLRNRSCPKCSKRYKMSSLEYIEEVKKIHHNKYDYSLVEYTTMNNKIKIICPEHGLFEQTAWQHLRMKQGCSACSGNRRLTKEKLEDMFVSKFGSDLVDFSNIRDIKNNSEKLEFICKKCKKVFYKSSQKLLARGGHYCNYFSKGEVLIENILRNNSKEYIKQYSFDDCTNNLEGRLNRKLLFDFFIPDKNVLIEFQGEQHFTPIKKFGGFDDFLIRIKNDSIKREYAFNKKIEILYINFWEIEKIEKILRDKELI